MSIDPLRVPKMIVHVVAALIALCLVGPTFYMLIDREPPWTRLSGTIEPTHAGALISVHWKTTPFVRPCPGTIQIEIISGNLIWPVLSRPAQTASYSLYIGQTEWDPPGWPLADETPPGPAIYRVTSFWYCNRIQEFLGWPIQQSGPDIAFMVLPEKQKDVR